ncbi:MAG: hypothetical protein R2747_22285 [Pyrinomonadaceae bacterium]
MLLRFLAFSAALVLALFSFGHAAGEGDLGRNSATALLMETLKENDDDDDQ